MAGEANVTTAAAILKTLWPEDAVEDETLAASPAFGMLPKSDEFEGDGTINLIVSYALQQGVAGNLGDAVSNATANAYKKYVLPLATIYGYGKIAGMLIRQSRSNKGSLTRALDAEQKSLNKQTSRIASLLAWGNGGGALARIDGASDVTTDTITLADKTRALWLAKGMVIQLATTDGTSGAVKAGTATILKVNRRLGTVQFTAALDAGVATAANTDYIFLRGLFGTGGEYPVPLGFEAWNPSADPGGADSFLGINRSEAPEELAGLRFLDPQANIEETIGAAYAYADNEGEFPDTLLMNPLRVHELSLSIKERERNVSEVVRVARGSMSGGKEREVAFGYSGIKYVTARGVVEVFADQACPLNAARAITEDDWKIYHLGALPHVLSEDGLTLERIPGLDVYGWRTLMAYNQACLRPKGQMYIQLALARGNTMGHTHNQLLGYDRGCAVVPCSFVPNDADDPDPTLTVGKGVVVTQPAAGRYRFTFRQRYALVQDARATLWSDVLLEPYHFKPNGQGVDADGNSYVDLDFMTAGKASIFGNVNVDAGVAASLDGLTLIINTGSGQQTVTFATPADIAAVVAQVDAQTSGLTPDDFTVALNHKLRLTSDTTGQASSIEVVGGTGATALGFGTGQRARGVFAKASILSGTHNVVTFAATVFTRGLP
jgi:hypothetical protein